MAKKQVVIKRLPGSLGFEEAKKELIRLSMLLQTTELSLNNILTSQFLFDLRLISINALVKLLNQYSPEVSKALSPEVSKALSPDPKKCSKCNKVSYNGHSLCPSCLGNSVFSIQSEETDEYVREDIPIDEVYQYLRSFNPRRRHYLIITQWSGENIDGYMRGDEAYSVIIKAIEGMTLF